MGTESNLIFREERTFYKRLGLILALIPSLVYIYMFGIGGIKYVKKYNTSYFSSEAAAYLPENLLAIKMAVILVPIVFFFALGAILITRFAQQQFQELEVGRSVTFKTLNSGFRKTYTRAHVVYFLLSIVCGIIYMVWLSNIISTSTPLLANGPDSGSDFFKYLFRLGKWAAMNCVAWLMITLPVACTSALILKLTSLKSEFD